MEISLIQNDDEENGNVPCMCSVGLTASLYQGYTEETIFKYSTQFSNVKCSVAYWLPGQLKNRNSSKQIEIICCGLHSSKIQLCYCHSFSQFIVFHKT